MTKFTKILAAGSALATLAAAAPAAAQVYPYASPYAYSPYAANPYASPHAYSPYAANPYAYNQYSYNPYAQQATAVATQRCTAAVQSRLQSRVSLSSILGAVLGANTATSGRVLSITQVTPRNSTVRVRGLASSGRYAGYGPYGVGAYGALGYAAQPDLSFSCTVDYRGYVRDVDINRRF